jgi:HSP20 family protein
MAEIIRHDPFENGGGMRRMMERFLGESLLARWPGFPELDEGTLAIDVSEKENEVVVRATLPGFQKGEIDVQLRDGVLSIKADHSEEEEEKDEHYYRRERRYGAVSRRVALPGVVNEEKVRAELKDGVLTLRVPLAAKERPKKIEIQSA